MSGSVSLLEIMRILTSPAKTSGFIMTKNKQPFCNPIRSSLFCTSLERQKLLIY